MWEGPYLLFRGLAVADPYLCLGTDRGLAVALPQCDDNTSIEDGFEGTSPEEEVPNRAARLAIHPNPFNPQTTITFALERDEWAKVAVYELTGKRVAVIANRTFTGGEHSLTWNGCDFEGHVMPSGTYLVRLETESGVEARKVSLIR